jgi:hypothetical protein
MVHATLSITSYNPLKLRSTLMQSIKRVALSSPESSYPDGKSRYVISQMFTQFGGHTGEVKLYEYDREVSRSPPL